MTDYFPSSQNDSLLFHFVQVHQTNRIQKMILLQISFLFILTWICSAQILVPQDPSNTLVSILQEEIGLVSSNGTPSNHTNSNEFQQFFDVVASSNAFKHEIWQQKPILIPKSHHSIQDSVFDQFQEELLLQLVQQRDLTFSQTILTNGSWYPQSLDISSNWDEWSNHLLNMNGTIHLDHANQYISKLSMLSNTTDHSFGLPSTINIYISPPHLEISTPPHTDEQDVFIVQILGSKHWRIYPPPDAGRDIRKDPFNRGKAGDVLDLNELEDCLLDTVLEVGDILYIPKGFPHETDTTKTDRNSEKDENVGSLHLTIGIDSHFYGLTYAHLRSLVLTRANLDLGNIHVGLDGHWEAMRTLPLGFLSHDNVKDGDDDEKSLDDFICSELKRIMKLLEPKRWSNDSTFPTDEEIRLVIRHIREEHLPMIMKNQKEMVDQITRNESSNLMFLTQTWMKKQRMIMERYYKFGRDDAMIKLFEI